MKRELFRILLVSLFVVSISGIVSADVVLTFDPDDIIQQYPADSTGQKATQEDARRVHDDWGNPYYGTFSDYMQSGHTQPEDYNTYMNWRESLGAGEGIAMFNSWFYDNPRARSWGEAVVVKPGTTVIGTAADGWNVRIIVDPYSYGGGSVQWWTTDPSKYINTLSDIGEFSITADLYWDTGVEGWDEDDVPVQFGELVRFWVGGLNGDDPDYYMDGIQALYFDDKGWGELEDGCDPFSATYGYSAKDYGSGFEAALEVTAVPVPGAVLLGSIGLGFAGWICKRKKL
ncbi:MAG: hypothetical protein JW837_15525 [Sedimentisphaerales bacterium]|nr:hypothetical protein [Sedimentisphaerales bacterium]